MASLLFLVGPVQAGPIDNSGHFSHDHYHHKSGASVRLLQTQIVINDIGEVVELPLRFDVGHQQGVMRVSIPQSEGIELLNGSIDEEITLDGSGVYQIPVSIRSLSSGKFYLPVIIVVESGRLHSHRALTIAVDVGGEAALRAKQASDAKIIPDGRMIKPMAAEEQIR
jgi:hypothetical protein